MKARRDRKTGQYAGPSFKPDAINFNPDPEYISGLIRSTGLDQQELGEVLGVSDRTIRQWMSGARHYKYPVQFTLEALVLHPDL